MINWKSAFSMRGSWGIWEVDFRSWEVIEEVVFLDLSVVRVMSWVRRVEE